MADNEEKGVGVMNEIMSKADVIELIQGLPDDLEFAPVLFDKTIAEWGEDKAVRLFEKLPGFMVYRKWPERTA